LRAFIREKSDVVFPKGSYVSAPVEIAAWMNRVPLATHESDYSLGLANRILARLATALFLARTRTGTAPSSAAQSDGLVGEAHLFAARSRVAASRGREQLPDWIDPVDGCKKGIPTRSICGRKPRPC
jgi:UDP-N-acetylglucosamine:LPS N-acetylglucosamine transferase